MLTKGGFVKRLVLVLGITAVIFVTGCGGAKKKEDEGGVPTAPAADENIFGDSDSGKAMGLQTVHFPYDSFVLDAEGKGVLSTNASVLKEHPNLKIQIEGHCDQRGGIQYNIALGEKRANAVKKYLVDLGVAGDRMSVISLGKEKPIDPGMSDEAFAKNRRANFVITAH
jgi:peptidoglycan-associated lipoprotein